MATGMTRWLGLTAVGIVTLTLLALPLRPPGVVDRNRNAQDELSRTLSTEIGVLNRSLRVVRVQDSLRAVLAALPEPDDGILVSRSAAYEDLSQLDVVEAQLRRDVDGLPERRQDVVLATFTVPADQGVHPDAFGGSGQGLEWFAGRLEDGRPYCIMTIAEVPMNVANDQIYGLDVPGGGSRLGPCAYWARFGPPGAPIEQWLARGGSSFTMGGGPPPTEPDAVSGAPVSLFGRSSRTTLGLGGPLLRCVAGELSPCEDALLLRNGHTGTRAWSASMAGSPGEEALLLRDSAYRAAGRLGRLSPYWWGPLGTSTPYVMADLEREFGSDALHSFWTSEAPIDQAFRTAFGVDPGPWTRDRLLRHHPDAHRSRTLPKPLDSLSVVALLGLVALVGGAISRQRQVG